MTVSLPIQTITPKPEEAGADRGPEALRTRLLDLAKGAFAAEGLHRTTMDDVARLAGCSKKTIYKVFDSKEALFEAVLHSFHGTFLAVQVKETLPPEAALRDFLLRIADVMLEDKALALQRIAVAEASRGFTVTRPESPDGKPIMALEIYLDKLERQGSHDFGGPQSGAKMLIGMALGAFHQHSLINMIPRIEQNELEAHVTRAVAIFLRGGRRD
jgi:TetR/AcrR family transcriptional regulator, mexJK operon transcriptional repressor